MDFNRGDTAVVFIDPPNEVLVRNASAGGPWATSVKENKTIEDMERIFKAAKDKGFEVSISPYLGGMLANIGGANFTCANCWNRVLRFLSSRTPQLAPGTQSGGDGYKAALINFGFLAQAVLSTDEVVKAMK